MRRIASLAALTVLMAATALSGAEAPADTGSEAALVHCVVDKDMELARALKDAPSEGAFMESIRMAVELCPTDVDQFSMGRLFDALHAALASSGEDAEAVERGHGHAPVSDEAGNAGEEID